MPTCDDDFEYSLCKIVMNCGWADFKLGTNIANAVKKSRKEKLPTDWRSMEAHPEAVQFREAFDEELNRYRSTGTILPNYKDIDWEKIDPKSIGHLMLLFSKQYNSDGSFKKYKCRIVFRGDRWINVDNHSRYASSVDTDTLFLFLGIVASEDLDMWKMDVQTAFLYNDFPDGMRQYVYSPHGVPRWIMPRRFELGHCTYGHPLASRQWEEKNVTNLVKLGFQKVHSAKSIMQIPATPTSDLRPRDDCDQDGRYALLVQVRFGYEGDREDGY